MSDFEDLDDVFGALRSPATPSELSGETGMVDLMASNHRATKGSTMFTSRRSRVAALIAAGVIGFGGVAAAGPGGLLDSESDVTTTTEAVVVTTTTEAVDVTTTTEAVDVTTTTAAVADDDVVKPATVESEDDTVDQPTTTAVDPDPSTVFNEAYCLEGNHGKTVSAVARGEAPFEDVEVRDAAQSSCGKDDDDENEAVDDDSSDDSVDDDADEDEVDVEDDEQDHSGKGKGGENKPAENRGKSGKSDD